MFRATTANIRRTRASMRSPPTNPLEQLVALGYIEKPDENRRAAVERTIRELEYNLGESLQDAGRHREAARALHPISAPQIPMSSASPSGCLLPARPLDSTTKCAASCRISMAAAAGFSTPRHRTSATCACRCERNPTTASPDEMRDLRRQLAYWRRMARYQPALVDYLKAQLLTRERRYSQALTLLESISESHLMRPGVLLETADLYMKLGRLRDAARLCRKALRNRARE